jgi:hypothetical protein
LAVGATAAAVVVGAKDWLIENTEVKVGAAAEIGAGAGRAAKLEVEVAAAA